MSLHRQSPSSALRRAVGIVAAGGLIAAGLSLVPAAPAAAADFPTAFASMGSGTDQVVSAMAANEDFVYAAGPFTTMDGASISNIASYDIALSSWIGLGSFAIAPEVLETDSSGDLYAGGVFPNANGAPNSASIAKWDGSSWSGFGDASQALNGGVDAIAFGPTGTLYIAGSFSMAGSTGLNYVAKWNGSAWLPLGTGVDRRVRSIAVDSQDNVYVAGDFTAAGGSSASHIAKWNGTSWSGLGSGLDNFGSVNVDIAIDSNDLLYAVGHFDTAGGISVNQAAKWDGTSWSGLAGGLALGIPFDIMIDSANQVYAAGAFLTAKTAQGSNVGNTIFFARWSGSEWQGMSPTFNGGGAYSMAIGGLYGRIYVGGSFTSAGATSGLGGVAQVQPGPTISSVTPARVSTAGGTTIAVRGAALNGLTMNITIGGNPPNSYTLGDQSEFTAEVGPMSPGATTLSVTTPGGTGTATLTYVDPPTVTSVSPTAGPLSGGNTVHIFGTSLTDSTGVEIGGLAASDLVVVSDTEITVTAPAHVADLSDVKVTSAFGDDTLANAYRFAAPPVITNLSPSSGTSLGGTLVTIDGASFTGATRVDFGPTPGTSLTIINDTQLTVESPAGAGFDLGITVTGPGGSTTSAGVWDYLSPPSAPRNLRQTGKAKGSMTFAWSTPPSDGGEAIVGYKLQYRKHGASSWSTRPALVTGRTVTVGNLRAGTKYDIRVAAKNTQVGTYASVTATSPAVPGAPTRVSASVRGSAVHMKWKRAAVQTGSTRTANLIKCVKGSTKKKVRLSAGATSGSLTLGRGTWSCRVYAYTEAGHGPGSSAKSVTIG